MRGADSVARLGGDEFACLLSAAPGRTAAEVATRIRTALHRTCELEMLPLQVETSVGIAIYPHHGADGDALLKSADLAMYAAKQTGAGQLVYAPGEHTDTPERLMLVSELRRALDERELCLHFQPKVKLPSCRWSGGAIRFAACWDLTSSFRSPKRRA